MASQHTLRILCLFTCSFLLISQCSSQGTVQFIEANRTVALSENAESKQHCVELEVINRNVTFGEITVRLQIINNSISETATLGDDFTLDNESVTFQTNVNILPVCVTFLDDNEPESDEVFSLEIVPPALPFALGSNNKVSFKILDADDRMADDEAIQTADTESNTLENELVIMISVGIALVGIFLIVLILLAICVVKRK